MINTLLCSICCRIDFPCKFCILMLKMPVFYYVKYIEKFGSASLRASTGLFSIQLSRFSLSGCIWQMAHKRGLDSALS